MNFPQTANELQQILEERKLYPWHAAANGREPHDGYCLKRLANGWVVYLSGPWAIPEEQHFDSEAAAVANLIERMRSDAFASYLEDL
jgi:hypothetical protein